MVIFGRFLGLIVVQIDFLLTTILQKETWPRWISQISGWMPLWNLDMMLFMDVMCLSVAAFDLKSSSSTNGKIPVQNTRWPREQEPPPVLQSTQHTTWAALVALSKWRTTKRARNPTKPTKDPHVKDCTDWWLNLLDFSWHCLWLNPEPIVNHFLWWYGTSHENQGGNQNRRNETKRFGPLHDSCPRILGQDWYSLPHHTSLKAWCNVSEVLWPWSSYDYPWLASCLTAFIMFDRIPDAFCLQKLSGQSPLRLWCFHVFFVRWRCSPITFSHHNLCPVIRWCSRVRWWRCARSAGPGQFQAKPCWWSDWCWDELVFHGKNHFWFLFLPFSFFLQIDSSYLHIYFNDPFTRQQDRTEREREREREYLSSSSFYPRADWSQAQGWNREALS